MSTSAVPGTPGTPAARVAVLDDDHVLRFIAALLTPSSPESARVIADFVRSERIDPDELPGLGARWPHLEVVSASSPTTDADVLLTRRAAVSAERIAASPRLRLVQRFGSFSGDIDLQAAEDRGVVVSCLPRPSLISVAEHALLMMLALSRRLLTADRAVRRGSLRPGPVGATQVNWAELDGLGTLHGRTLGLVGMGEVAAIVALRAAAFGMRVLYTDGSPSAARRARESGAEQRSLSQLLAASDFVSIHVRGGPENAEMFDAAALAAMKPGAILVNTSRGSVIDEDALLQALRSGRLAGAGLDVHRREPRPDGDPLCALDSVLLTPHIAGGSRRLVVAEAARVIENIAAVLEGRTPPHGHLDRS